MDKILLEEAASYGTPVYLFDLNELAARTQACKDILGQEIVLCYSIKANPFLVPAMDQHLSFLEVCSPGELEICAANHVPASHILLSGVNKGEPDIRRALELGVRLFTCESPRHAHLLQDMARSFDLTLSVLLRLTAGSQFGMDEDDLLNLIRNRDAFPNLSIEGIHYFSGTQRKKLDSQRKELQYLARFCETVRETLGFQFQKIEYGTGLYYPYFTNEDFSDTLAPLRELAPDLHALADSTHVSLTVEMGRFFASSCGYFLTSVVDVKTCRGQQIAILDGGIHHLNYYGGTMGMRVPVITRVPKDQSVSSSLEPDSEPTDYMLCGSLCTTADVLVRAYPAPKLEPKDLLIFHNCGAYSVTEAPALFLSRDLPTILTSDSRLHVIRQKRPSWTLNTAEELT